MTTQPSKHTTNRAMKQLTTWCQSVGIDVQNRNGTDLEVLDSSGQKRNVAIVMSERTPKNALFISAVDLTSRTIKDSFDAFKILQQELGFEPKLPVDRGPLPARKLANNEDLDLAAFRHTEFRRSPDPAPDKFKAYDAVMNRACRRFYRQNKIRCDDHMLTVEDDLKSYAMVWMTNFCGLYELADKSQSENEGLLFTYLMQRFNSDFREGLQCKERSEFAKLDDAYIGTRGQTYDYSNKASWYGDDPRIVQGEEASDEEVEYVDQSTTEGRVEVRIRAAVFGAELDERLSALGHDRMVELLTQAADNDRIHPDARAEAQKRLDAHVASCDACKVVETTPAPEAVQAAPVAVTTSAAETVERRMIIDEVGRTFATAGEAARATGGIHRDHVKAILAGAMGSFQGHTFRFVNVLLPVEVAKDVTGSYPPG